MSLKGSTLSLILGLAGLGILFVLISKPASAKKGGTGTTGQTGSSTLNQTGFPVTSNSDPATILSAFRQSGYYSQLETSQQRSASSDPETWLGNHTYLFTMYPDFFSDGSSSGTSTSYVSPHGR